MSYWQWQKYVNNINPHYVFIEFEEQHKCGEKTWKRTNYLAKGGVFTYTMSALQKCMLCEPTSPLDDFLLLTVYFTCLLEHVNLHPYWHLSPLLEGYYVCL